MLSFFSKGPALILVFSTGLALTACSRSHKDSQRSSQVGPSKVMATTPLETHQNEAIAAKERKELAQEKSGEITSSETKDAVRKVLSHELQVEGDARIAVLYFLDRPAHRASLVSWLEDHKGKVAYDNAQFGYMDASLPWEQLEDLIRSAGDLGLTSSSIFKLELYDLAAQGKVTEKAALESQIGPEDEGVNSSLFGSVHSAGYGIKVEEFRKQVAADTHKQVADIEGQGTLVAIYDGGLDLSRKDVFGDRVKDFYLGTDSSWLTATTTLAGFRASESLAGLPAGLTDLENNDTLKFVTLNESDYKTDFNGNGNTTDEITVATFEKDGVTAARVRPAQGLAFGDTLVDFAIATARHLPSAVNLYTGELVKEIKTPADPSVAGVKFRVLDGKRQIAFVGLTTEAKHGTSNAHMVGGDFTDAAHKVNYRGVAPKTQFLMMQSWSVGNTKGDYGEHWLPLARTIVEAAAAKADVLDLDIYTPGTRNAQDMLSSLLCRVTAKTNSVPVVASHNYGPLSNTIQNLAQSPCVLAIGAAHSVSGFHESRLAGSINPTLIDAPADKLITASYSGRGLAQNGQFKPDIIAPAYAYTAYGPHFTRFGGTSGATPTTAGAIALLKQAARFYNVELGFEQVRFLFQGSSEALASDKVLDGYGNLNLLASWNAFKQLYVSTADVAPRFSIGGQKLFAYEGRPNETNLKIDLSRADVLGSVNTPEHLKVWIEFAGASDSQTKPWLKLYDKYSNGLANQIDFDAPMFGETVPLRFAFDLSDADWNALPVGNHVAIIKAVRTGLKGARNVDFAMPVMIVKGLQVAESRISVPDLYADESFTLPIATKPGETIFLYPQITCAGQTIGSTSAQNIHSLDFVADSSNFIGHASEVMNTYAPITLSSQPIRIVAERNILNLAFIRYRQNNCLGAINAQVDIRRLGFAISKPSTSVAKVDDAFVIKYQAQLAPTAAPLNADDIIRGTTWSVATEKKILRLAVGIDGDFSFKVPKGFIAARLIPKDASQFQAILVSINDEGEVLDSANSINSHLPGFASLAAETKGAWVGLEIIKGDVGDFITVKPLSLEGFAGTVLELDIDPTSDITVTSTNAKITSLLVGTTSKFNYTVKGPSSLAAYTAGFDTARWTAQVGVEVSVVETSTSTDTGAIVAPLTLWKTWSFTPIELK